MKISEQRQSAKWPDPGDGSTKYGGKVLSASDEQSLTFGDRKPEWWDDEHTRPIMNYVITIQLDEPLDDGQEMTTFYAKGGNYIVEEGYGQSMRTAIEDAVRAKERDEVVPGDWLGIAFTGYGKAKQEGYNRPKLFTAEFRPAPPKGMSVGADKLFSAPATEQQ